jgi:hypothetical protein
VVHAVRAGILALVLAMSLVVAVPGAHAEHIPQTLAERRDIQVAPVDPAFSIDYVGVLWDVPAGATGRSHEADGRHGHDGAPHGEIRLRHGSRWGAWIPLAEDGAQAPGQWTGGLVPAGDADAYQVRGIPADAEGPQAVAINATDGPAREIRTRPVSAAALPPCVSRYDWGADETLRSSVRAFADVQVMTVHHTATENADTDPKATMRAIYRYHTVDNGWDDIGYQYVIDEGGRLYEGRWSGADSEPCESDPPAPGAPGVIGDGSDFAHDELNRLVTGAHTGGYNTGNVGVALLGDFRDHRRFGADPQQAAVTALEDTLAGLANRHGFTQAQLRGDEKIAYDNGVNRTSADAISGHRDFGATECPGQRLYDLLATIRANVAEKAGEPSEPTDPPAGGALHVGGLSGASAPGPGPNWDATVTITVHDDGHGGAAGATVAGEWKDGSTAACTTATDGTCAVTQRVNGKKDSVTTFTVLDVSRAGDSYDPAANHDPSAEHPTVTVGRP